MSLIEPTNRTADLSALKIRRDSRPDRGRWVLPAVATGIVVLVALVLVWSRATGATLRAPEVSVTRVALVTPTQASTVLTASGYIVARSKAEISPKSVGRVAWLNLEEGQKVRKGELVARLESQELEAQRKQYAASREQALAELVNARLERQRAATLLKDLVGSQQAFDAADSRVKSLEAGVASIEAQVRYVEELIKNSEIYAPIDGVVTVKKAFVGETVAPQGFGGAGSAGATFAVIVDLGSLEMEADINEQNLGRLAIGQPAEVALDAYPDKPYKARLRDRPHRGPAEGLREGEDRDPRPGRADPPGDVVPRRLPEPGDEGRHGGEAEGDGPVRVSRRGRREEGGPPREGGRGRLPSAGARSDDRKPGGGRVGRRRRRGDRRRGGGHRNEVACGAEGPREEGLTRRAWPNP